MGAEPRKLGVKGEQELSARGVSYCATCDAAFFRDKPTLIVGGGDSAMEEAIFLSKFASEVKLVHRRDDFRASQIMLDRARGIDNIEFVTPYVVDSFEEGESGSLARAVLRHANGGVPASADHDDDAATPAEHEGAGVDLDIEGAFIAVGHRPNSVLVEGQVETDEDGYVLTEGKSTRTNIDGVFAAGDLVDHTYRQAITAAGTGCQAALDAERWLRDTPVERRGALGLARRGRRGARERAEPAALLERFAVPTARVGACGRDYPEPAAFFRHRVGEPIRLLACLLEPAQAGSRAVRSPVCAFRHPRDPKSRSPPSARRPYVSPRRLALRSRCASRWPRSGSWSRCTHFSSCSRCSRTRSPPRWRGC